MFLLDGEFCMESAKAWQLVGKILVVFKIVIPLLLIIFGMIDLGKAVISSEEKAIKEATNSLLRRAIAAVVIFFVPTIVNAVFGLVSSFGEASDATKYDNCRGCLVHPNSADKCDTSQSD